MIFTGEELATISSSLHQDRKKGGPKLFLTVGEQVNARKVWGKVKDCIDSAGKDFVESEIDFGTEEKTFILDLLKPESFPAIIQELVSLEAIREKLA